MANFKENKEASVKGQETLEKAIKELGNLIGNASVPLDEKIRFQHTQLLLIAHGIELNNQVAIMDSLEEIVSTLEPLKKAKEGTQIAATELGKVITSAYGKIKKAVDKKMRS